ncbi:MAG: GTPase Era [Anaerolineae bacterium]
MKECEEGRDLWEFDPDASPEYGEADHEPEQAEEDEATDGEILENEEGAESEALIEQFLAEAGGTVLREEGVDEAWPEEPLPEGHKSGFVALIGRPNVGKSTLVNALVGHKVAIVSRKPQTTRSRVTGIRTRPDHQLIFVDTPGIHQKPPHQLNKLMIEEALAAIPDSDVLLFVVDVSTNPRREDRYIATLLKEKGETRPVIFALNKMDLLPLDRAEARIEAYWSLLPTYADSMPISALRGTNLDRLLDRLLDYIPEGPRYYPGDQVTDQTEHQIAAELIREAVFKHTREEIPHASAVLIEDYHERENGVFYVAARIWVERDSQKAIVIGKNGQRLKQIGIDARAELERLIGGHVYLDLWVKVQPRWRDHMARLRELGY